MKKYSLILALVCGVSPAMGQSTNDYPTVARAEFVFGCMGANGQTPETLYKCSCSIDVIASIIPYDRYVQIETVMRMQQVPGERTVAFRTTKWANALVDEFKSAEAEATLKCF